MIFSLTKDKREVYTKLAKWYNDVTDSGFKAFNSISATICIHYKEILKFLDNRSTNASTESFNAKLKAFRSNLRGGEGHFLLPVHSSQNLCLILFIHPNVKLIPKKSNEYNKDVKSKNLREIIWIHRSKEIILRWRILDKVILR